MQSLLYQKTTLNKETSFYQQVLFYFNNEIVKIERLHRFLADLGYTNEEINKLNLQDNSLYSVHPEEDLIQCKQSIMFYIFRAKIYKDQLFYNDLCYQYFV